MYYSYYFQDAPNIIMFSSIKHCLKKPGVKHIDNGRIHFEKQLNDNIG